MRILSLHQGSPDWHVWRKKGCGSTAAYSVTGLAPHPWGLTRSRVWEEMTGLRQPEPPNVGMRRGQALEPGVRKWHTRVTGLRCVPACVVHDEHNWLRASLDGMDLDAAVLLEIKCPGRETHAMALAGEIPEHYRAQVQHQLYVTGLPRAHYLSFCDNGFVGRDCHALLEVGDDPTYQRSIIDQERDFWRHVESGTRPTDHYYGWLRVPPSRKWDRVCCHLDEAACMQLLHAHAESAQFADVCVLPAGRHPARRKDREGAANVP